MSSTLRAAVSEATQANRQRYKEYYLTFCGSHAVLPLLPTAKELCMYLQYLFNNMSSIGSMENYFSGARIYIDLLYGDSSPFSSRAVVEMKRGMRQLSTHVPAQAPPIFPDQLTLICAYCDTKGVVGAVHKAAILISYYTFLRQSNVVTTIHDEVSPHVMNRADVSCSPDGLLVKVRSSKTIRHIKQQVVLPVNRLPEGSKHCPVVAYKVMLALCPGQDYSPAFHLPGGQPVTARQLQSTVRSALKTSGICTPGAYTLHSLRRGAAQKAAMHGVAVGDIQSHGTWSSDSVYTYTPRHIYSAVPHTLTRVLGITGYN